MNILHPRPIPRPSPRLGAIAAYALTAVLLAGGCDAHPIDTTDTVDSDSAAVPDQHAADVVDGGEEVADTLTPETAGDAIPDSDTEDAVADVGPVPLDELLVGDDACCMGFTDTKAVWAELEYAEDATCDVGGECFGDGCKGFRSGPETYVCKRLVSGKVWVYDRASGVKSALDPSSEAIQKDPVIAGSTVIWADRRNGTDFDLWQHNLETGTTSALVLGLGDQDEPTLDGTRLAWIGRNEPPHTAAEREVWTMDITDPDSKERLTNDTMEQTQPHCAGGRIVWTDYAADPDGIYNPVADPLSNNGDIVGYDLATQTTFVVEAQASKQTRPGIDGDYVVWLDWRGINPEPKYSQFQVYGARITPLLEIEQVTELAGSYWQRPSLWQRPTVKSNGLAGWIQEGAQAELSAIFIAKIGPNPVPTEVVTAAGGFFEGVQILDDQIGYVGAGKLGWFPLDAFTTPQQ